MKDTNISNNDVVNVSLSDSEKKQSNYYNEIAETYDRHYSNPYALEYRHRLYLDILKSIDLENMVVLDAMCGGGQTTELLLKKNARVTGLDISKEQCRIFKERYPESGIVCASLIDTPFPDASFDIVFIDSLHHLHPHTDKGLEEIHRILKPSGYLLLWEPCAKSLFDLLRKIWYKLDPKYFQSNEQSIDLKKITRDHQSHFTLIRQKYGGNFAYLFVQESMAFRINPRIIRFYARSLMALEHFLNRLQPSFLSFWVLALLKKNGDIRL